MKRQRAAVVLTVLCALIFVSGCAGLQRQIVEPDFEWDPTFASPGASLMIEEAGRSPAGREGGTFLQYNLSATGFPEGDGLDFWWKRDNPDPLGLY